MAGMEGEKVGREGECWKERLKEEASKARARHWECVGELGIWTSVDSHLTSTYTSRSRVR